jgi:predicted AAA+ superfamily ATPase
MVVGGMPEVVQRYADTRDLLAIDDIYETLLQAYRDDVEKYVRSNKLSDTVRFILEHGWLMAGETVTLTGFAGSNYKAKEVGEAFRLLQKAMLLELVYPTTHTDAPIMTEMKRQPKLIWLDTGLVNHAAGIRSDIIHAHDLMDTWRGRVAEHIVAQELLTLNDRISQRRAFWTRGKGGNSAEVDFVWQMDGMVIPIEVKSGADSHLRSLHSFIDNSSVDIAVRVWSGEYREDDLTTIIGGKRFKLFSLPFYMVGNMEKIIKKGA